MIAPIPSISIYDAKRFEKVAQLIKANTQSYQQAFKQSGVIGLSVVQKSFNDRSTGRNPAWKPLSAVTVLLRRKGVGKRIENEADLAAKKVQPLRDTGLGARSLTAQSADAVNDATPLGVTFGSRLGYFARQAEGFVSVFRFTDEMKARFFKNVRVLIPNPRRIAARIRLTEMRSAARSDKSGVTNTKPGRKYKPYVWSKFAWNTWRILKGMEGRSYKVPARPVWNPQEASDSDLNRIVAPVERLTERLMKDA